MKLTIYSLTWDARNACSQIGTMLFATKAARDAKLLEWARSWNIEIKDVDDFHSDRVTDALAARDVDYNLDDHEIELPDNDAAKLAVLIAACQAVSRWAPKPEVPMIENLTPEQAPDTQEGLEALAYDAGLYHAAEHIRMGLRDIGVEPEDGTTEWYHQLSAAEDAA